MNHNFSLEEAIGRVRALTGYWDKKYGTRTEWQESRARIKGKVKMISFDGTFSIDDKKIEGEVEVGFLAEKMGGRAYVERKLTEYLDPKNSLQDLEARI